MVLRGAESTNTFTTEALNRGQ